MKNDFRSDIIRLVQLLKTCQGNIKNRSHRNLRFLAVRVDFNMFYEKLSNDLQSTTTYTNGINESKENSSGSDSSSSNISSGGKLTTSQLMPTPNGKN